LCHRLPGTAHRLLALFQKDAARILAGLGILPELTGRRRDRVFAYDGYLRILSEGTEPL
jgi:hypothetical protein